MARSQVNIFLFNFPTVFWASLKRLSAESVLYLDLYPLPGLVCDFTYSRGEFSYSRIRKLETNKATRRHELSALAGSPIVGLP